ncbi:MAG TPA: tRNA (guanosine(46)-N7)-methyltransferase TrmB, partial [Chthoniobacteraceae bacterium]|nr:tRNA (guanosine(46)-N7)-methyltransferase TrmB [Chthoniobacteraceae bacterium]
MDAPPAPDQIEYTPSDYFAPLPLDAMFGREAPVQIDLGCGEGAFLVAMAKAHPECNFIGIERLVGRVRKACKRSARAGLRNVRVMCIESLYTVSKLISPESIAVIHVMFPDPWPKRKHRRRRLVNSGFLDAVRAALPAGGELRLTTDDADYFEQMKRVASAHEGFAVIPWPDDPDYPRTDFEKHFRAQGLEIRRLLL